MSPERKTHSRLLYPDLEIFPKEEVEAIKQRGDELVSPFWIFNRFGAFYPAQNRDLIIAKLSQTTYGNELNFIETPKGVRINASNIEPLLDALSEIYLSSLELLSQKTRNSIDNIFKPKK